MLPQPPPDVPTPPPSPAAIRSRRFRLGIWIVGLFSVVCVGVLLTNAILAQRNKAATSEAHDNLRSMSCALAEFDVAYGKYPDASTIAAVRENTESLLPLGTKTSNDYFRQIIAAELQGSEANCFAPIAGSHKPDNRIDGANALEKGECGFSYIVGLSSKSNPQRPLVVTPLIPGTNRFDPKPFNGCAVILRIWGTRSGSIDVLPISKSGEVLDSSGKHILDPANPIWGGKPPVIAWPE